MEVLTIITTGICCIASFYIGAKVGQTVSTGKDIKVPTINPMQLYREREERKAEEKEKEVLDTVLYNIDIYDGTSAGQKDIPR